ncbi:DUF72 domain-containing protein [Actinomadura parmotrematis]|uniref:DUF72 domain-containing protein n=1 Tax=Actinomadura parmotrematis TaxID=2864039 RepID=A0ABS7FVE6_9ACTN|nr:DUF72 domain-containing protein [Actinomadura parmotrematis]MBW8483458.1 DUF72 domain-containing protein [Actinomadura parmotrematis]
MRLFVGTSGWQYDDWRGGLYPAGVAKKRWLERYAECFATTELNASFYYPVGRKTFEGWRQRTPEGFVMAVKAGRTLTHRTRLKEPREAVEAMVEAARGLGDRLGPFLVQLPPTMRAEPERLDATLRAFPKDVRVAVEPRHQTWWTDEVRGVLERHNAALCWADREDAPVAPLWRTADWGYLRFHEGTAEPWPMYGEDVLDAWLERLGEPRGDDWYVYFNNDPGGAAVRNAVQFAEKARKAGWDATRTPAEFPESLLQPASREWNTPD